MSKGDARRRLEQALADHGCTVRGNSAQCPGPGHTNGDRNPSLSIGGRRDGLGVVISCKGGDGCERDAILEALGLTVADLYDEPRQREDRRQVVAEYDYTDEDGALLFRAVRFEPKDFRQYHLEGARTVWNLRDVRRVLYRLPRVIEAVRSGQVIYVCEGEKDVHALEAAGVVATCNPMGAGKWRDEFGAALAGADVIIIADRDEPGRKHAAQVARTLHGRAKSVRVVEPAVDREKADASDHLAAGHGLDDFIPAQLESDTPDEPVSEKNGTLTSENDGSDGSDAVQYEMRDGTWLDGQRFAPLKYTVPGLMPAGLGIIAAPPKAGKSLLILDWLLAVASGGQALGALRVGAARDVLYLALEDGDRRLQARSRQLLAEGEPIPDRFRYILAVPPGQVLAVINDAIERYPDTGLIVLDTLGRIMPLPMQGETTYQRDYRVAVALKRIADEHPGLTIIVIHHTRKAFSDDFIDSISGTHGLAGAADTIITLTRSRGKGDGVLRVTGRDVIEADYAVTFHDGAWSLDGGTLAEARANVKRRAESGTLGERSAEIIEFVRQHPQGAQAKQVRDKFGDDADTYLKRLTDSGRLTRIKRGLYLVSETSEPSEPQVSGDTESDSGLWEVSETGWPAGSPGEEANS